MSTSVNENTEVSVPLKNIISLVVAASVATWAYFGIIEKINSHETKLMMMQADVAKNSEFRIRWPRGELGSLPADARQDMMIEHLKGEIEKLQKNIETGQAPYDQQQKLVLDFYEKRISAIEKHVEGMKNRR